MGSPERPADRIQRHSVRSSEELEARYVQRALELHGNNVTRAAAASGVGRRYFQMLRAKR